MRFSAMLGMCMLGVALAVSTGAGGGGEKKEKVKGQLPQGWKALGLSADQTEKIYKVQADHKAEIDKLTNQLNELKSKRQSEMVKHLTEAQKEQLAKNALGETKKKTEAKKDEKKTEDKK